MTQNNYSATKTDINQPLEPDDEIDLLDLLVTVAENIKLLIIGPIAAGLVALGVSFYAFRHLMKVPVC